MQTRRIAFLLIALAVVAAFGGVCLNDFVAWDDGFLIWGNPNLNPPTWEGLRHHWTVGDPASRSLYIPLTYTAWWALAHVAHLPRPDSMGATLNPVLFHGANLLLHLLAALVVMRIVERFTTRTWAACAGALVFAVHPIQTEAVAWATGMKDVLSGLLALVALWQYLESADPRQRPVGLSPSPGTPGEGRGGGNSEHPAPTLTLPRRTRGGEIGMRRLHSILAIVAFAAALLAKPSVVVLPLVAFIFDIGLLRRPWRKSVAALAPWTIPALVVSIITVQVQPASINVFGGPLWARPLIALDALAFYLGKLVLPFNLTIDYGRRPAALLAQSHAIYWTWIIPAALAVALAVRRQRTLVVAGLIFVVGLLPVLGLVTFVFEYYSTVADRFVYLSMLGPAMAVAWLLDRWPRPVVAAAAAIVLAVWVGLSYRQTRVWEDDQSLNSRAIDVNPQSFVGYCNLGDFYSRMCGLARTAQQRNDAATIAQDMYRRSIERNIYFEPAYDDMVSLLELLNQNENAMYWMQRWIENNDDMPPGFRTSKAALRYRLATIEERLTAASTQPAALS